MFSIIGQTGIPDKNVIQQLNIGGSGTQPASTVVEQGDADRLNVDANLVDANGNDKGTYTNPIYVAGDVEDGFASNTLFSIGGIYRSSAPTYTNGQYAQLQVNENGELKTTGGGGGGGGGEVEGKASEDAAASGKPVLIGGRFDSGARELDDGDAGAIAVTQSGAVLISSTNLATLAGAVDGTEVQVDVLTSALPTGAATAANQSTGNTSLAAIATDIAALEVLATAGNASLTDIETNTNYGAITGGGTESGALRVTIASDSTGVMTIDQTIPLTTQTTSNTAVSHEGNLTHTVDLGTSTASPNISLVFMVDSDDSQTDSFKIQVSHNNSTWYSMGEPLTTDTANKLFSLEENPSARYIRLLYTNTSGGEKNVGVVSSYYG